jgi:hypothetical protein
VEWGFGCQRRGNGVASPRIRCGGKVPGRSCSCRPRRRSSRAESFQATAAMWAGYWRAVSDGGRVTRAVQGYPFFVPVVKFASNLRYRLQRARPTHSDPVRPRVPRGVGAGSGYVTGPARRVTATYCQELLTWSSVGEWFPVERTSTSESVPQRDLHVSRTLRGLQQTQCRSDSMTGSIQDRGVRQV